MMLTEIRELTMTDISCELLLYGSADLSITISKKVFDAVHSFIDETGRLQFVIFTCESYRLVMLLRLVLSSILFMKVCVCVCMYD